MVRRQCDFCNQLDHQFCLTPVAANDAKVSIDTFVQ